MDLSLSLQEALGIAEADRRVLTNAEAREVMGSPGGWFVWGSPSQTIHFCPWCGEPFLGDNRNERWDIAEKEYRIDLSDLLPEEVPEELRTDAWWKSSRSAGAGRS